MTSAMYLSLGERKILEHLEAHAGHWFKHYDDPDLSTAFPDMKRKSVGWYLWMLHKKGLVGKKKEGKWVYFSCPPTPEVQALKEVTMGGLTKCPKCGGFVKPMDLHMRLVHAVAEASAPPPALGTAQSPERSDGHGGPSKKFTFTVFLERDEDGFIVASCPALPGCHTQGKTREEALANIREAIRGYIASMRRHGEAIPVEDVAQVEVAA